ncbi:MAG: hypothetical protein LBE82_06945 [Chitinophagaceae bacterium]|nr:hypothetical protein [Chitinophagaceae bacterium]
MSVIFSQTLRVPIFRRCCAAHQQHPADYFVVGTPPHTSNAAYQQRQKK